MCSSSGGADPPEGQTVSLAACSSGTSFPGASAPAKPVSLAESAKSLPDWMASDTRVTVLGKPKGLPQIGGARAVFDGMGPVSADRFEGGLLACQVESNAAVGPDRFLKVSLQIGGMPEVTHQGKEKESGVLFTVPGVVLAKGEGITVRAALVDNACRVGPFAWWLPIPLPSCGEVTLSRAVATERFAGTFPVALSSKGFRAECRAMPRPAVEAALSKRLDDADAAFPRLCAALRLHSDHRQWGWPQSKAARQGHGEVDDTALLAAAGLVTWADPRITSRLTHYERIRTEWEGALGKWVAAETAKRTRGAEEGVRPKEVAALLPDGIACDAATSSKYRVEPTPQGLVPCFVRLVVKNLGSSPLNIEHAASGESDGVWLGGLAWRQMDIAFSTGHIARAALVAFVEGGKAEPGVKRLSIAGGGTAELVFAAAVREAEARGSAAALVRLFHDDEHGSEPATLFAAR